MKLHVKRGSELMLVVPVSFGSGGFMSFGETLSVQCFKMKKDGSKNIRITSDGSREKTLLWMEIGEDTPVTMELLP